jgi:hypothetical protein
MKENKKYKNKKEDEFLPDDEFLSDDEETRVLFSDKKEENLSGDKEDLFFDNEDLSLRVKKIVKIIDLLEFIDSCLIVSEKLVRDDEDAREILKDLREKILNAETIFTDYLISGKIQKPN